MNEQNEQNNLGRVNRVAMGDSYKYSQAMGQYPQNISGMFDYAEARSNKVYPVTILAGLQLKLMKYFTTPIEQWEVDEVAEDMAFHGVAFDKDGWDYIVQELGGYLPVEIRSIQEGIPVPTGNALFTIKSTDSRVPWVASWLETPLMTVWGMSNVLTRSYFVNKMLTEYANKTQDHADTTHQFHNFGARGSWNPEIAQEAGIAHLMAGFLGTDNFSAIRGVRRFYNNPEEGFRDRIAHSINATEHSSTASWGRENESEMIMNHLEINKGQYIIAAVCDTYDYFKMTREICDQSGEFQKKINTPEYPMFVMRPDSGNPEEIIAWTLDMMEEERVPFTVNNKGYKVFNKMRIIWGDGINMETMKAILDIFVRRGYSSENIAFGSGGWLVQQHDRDTQGWAIKNSQVLLSYDDPICKDGQGGQIFETRDVYKDPITAPNKASKKGELTLWYNHTTQEFFTDIVDFKTNEFPVTDMLNVIFRNGKMYNKVNLDQVRENAIRGL